MNDSLNHILMFLNTLLDKYQSSFAFEVCFWVGNWLLSQASVDVAPYFVITVEPLLM